MTPCDVIWDLLSLYADGEADVREQQAVESHVAFCHSCALDLQFMRESAVMLAQAPLVSPPPSLKHAILAATVYRPTWQERLRQSVARALPPARLQMAGVAAGIALVGLLLFKGMQQPQIIGGPAPAAHATHAPLASTTASVKTPSTAHTDIASNSGPKTSVLRNNDVRNRIDQAVKDIQESLKTPATVKKPILVSTPPPAATRPSPRRQNFRALDSNLAETRPAPNPEDMGTLSEPRDMRETMGENGGTNNTEIARNDKQPENRTKPEAVAPDAAPIHTKYTLASSLPSGGADTLVTFANLRRTLKERPVARTASLDLGMSDRSELHPFYTSKF